jgi:hypothetical protein
MFCADCVFLQGELKTVVCKDCYETINGKFEKSKQRRKIYILLSLILVIYSVWAIIAALWIDLFVLNLYINVSLLITALICGIVHSIAMRQMKKWALKEDYKK